MSSGHKFKWVMDTTKRVYETVGHNHTRQNITVRTLLLGTGLCTEEEMLSEKVGGECGKDNRGSKLIQNR